MRTEPDMGRFVVKILLEGSIMYWQRSAHVFYESNTGNIRGWAISYSAAFKRLTT